MADPDGSDSGQGPSGGSAPGEPFTLLMPVPFGNTVLFLPFPWPQPAPSPPVALTTEGTVSDVESAFETYKDVPARALTLDEAKAILLDLKSMGALTLKEGSIHGLASMPWGVAIGSFKVRKPAEGGQPASPWRDFFVKGLGSFIDPRLAVLVYRLATYLHVEHGATGMKTMGFLRSQERPELSCHNQGRAVDFNGVLWGAEEIEVAKHWGSIPFRQDGEVVKERWSATTKKFDQGNPVLGYKKILGFVSNSLADKVKQVRLDPEIVVDGATYQSVTGAADPGPPDTWSEDTKRAVEKLQVELRRAHKVFLGAFDFFVRESTLEGGAKAFTKDTMTEVFRKPVSPINSGNLCNPDGTAWSGHQDHFHVQIGVTRWAAEAASTEPQDPAQIDANARKLLYDRSAAMVLKLLDKAWAQVEKDAATARDAFERQKKWGKRPADAVWEDQPEAKTQARKLAIARAYTDEGIKRRIETFDADELPEIIAGDLIDFHTQRGRVLRRWYSRVKGASWGKPSRIGELAADGSLTDAAARERLVAEINAALTTWRDEVVAGK